MSDVSVGLLVLRAGDLEKTLRFYQALGLSFVEEKHGSGPLHYASQLNGMVIEIYPGKPGAAPDYRTSGAVMVGFTVASLDGVLAEIMTGDTEIRSAPRTTPWGRRAVVLDPDGRAVEISEPTQHT